MCNFSLHIRVQICNFDYQIEIKMIKFQSLYIGNVKQKTKL